MPQTRFCIPYIKTPLSIIVIKDNWERFDSLSNHFLAMYTIHTACSSGAKSARSYFDSSRLALTIHHAFHPTFHPPCQPTTTHCWSTPAAWKAHWRMLLIMLPPSLLTTPPSSKNLMPNRKPSLSNRPSSWLSLHKPT